MKRHYVVLRQDGYYEADNKKDAFDYLLTESAAHTMIRTTSTDGNYYHNRIKTIAVKD